MIRALLLLTIMPALANCGGSVEPDRTAEEEVWNLKQDTLIHSAPFTELSVSQDGSLALGGRTLDKAELPDVMAQLTRLEPAPVLVVTYEGGETPEAWPETIAIAESGYCDLPDTWCWKGAAADAPQEIREKPRNLHNEK
ncbi:hypothetical protein [Citromicrobium bathyomarinum]|uniref:hypothetical protein n=1 Tax=Citromicrobium bathyomarinum TaxID=72174 RepID=UPI001E319849|nr:hypothetical protein [Citromicrobium bathyomarinum]MCD1621797.1 hypothetical protein [Citromicrobium bathyomarinum]